MIPFEIENVRGIKIIAKKAGMASSSSSHLMRVTGFIIKTPTNTSGAAVATAGTIESKGEKKRNGKNKRPATTAVSPVRPPC